MSQRQSLPNELQLHALNYPPHAIFLSHSGAQKGFAIDLYKALSRSFSTFLDITDHSLPLGENFPKLIFRAAKDCKLAVVVLSEEFVCSKWPMLELTAFAAAKVNILPLFFKLSPSDLKHEENLKRWRKAWNSYAEQDPKHRIDVREWDSALQALSSQNGLILDLTSEGEQTFLDKIVFRISQIVPPTIKFDMRHMCGKDRLCKVILDKFEMMESREQEKDDPPQDRGTASTGGLIKPSCVLGLYGMPGSGKSTLCKCLRDHFFPMYGLGKVLYLKLPTNPSPADLIRSFKDLLSLTDFRGRINLDEVELEQMEYLLHGLSSCRVFLVIDNISEGSWRVVQRVFELGFGPGSKVILVARSCDVLHPILHTCENGISQCICDNMHMPTINETEAIQIILQSTIRAGTRALDGPYTLQENVSPRQRDIILGIVRMCGFRSGGDFLYLPLVMETMGAMLIKYKENLEGWRSDMESFWTRVKTYKEDAVEELIGESFKTLPHENLQLLFLDVALFILPLGIQKDEAHFCLSSMHGSTVSRMEMMMKDLERHCFLTVSKGGNFIEVHDVYIEFAKSISKGPTGFSNLCWMSEKHAEEETGKIRSMLTLKETIQTTAKSEYRRVRAMIIQELGPSCERVDLEGFSSLKAVCVRNSKAVEVVGLAGLSSLVSLDITQCAKFQGLECGDHDYASLLNVKRLKIVLGKGRESCRSKEVAHHVAEEQPYSIYPIFIKRLQRVFAPILRLYWNSFNVGMVRKMRNLQVLNIQNTGITRLEDMSRYWPQLQVLNVRECNLEALELGNLPQLQEFLFSDHDDLRYESWQHHYFVSDYERWRRYRKSESWRRKQGDAKFMLSGKDLLVGCPQLKRVFMESAFFEEGELGTLPPNLKVLSLRSFYRGTQLPDLSSSAYTLERLEIDGCEKLTGVEFLVGFENLGKLVLVNCHNLVEVTGLEGLPNLQALYVLDCYKLQTLNGFDNARMLKKLCLSDCHALKEISCLSGLTNLERIELGWCDQNLDRFMATADLHGLIKLRELEVGFMNGRQSGFRVGEFEHLEALSVIRNWRAGALEGWEKLVNLKRLWLCGNSEKTLSTLPLDETLSPLRLPIPMTAKLTSLTLWCLDDVATLDGIEHQVTLQLLSLSGLQNLRSVQGLEFFLNLGTLTLSGCPMLESLPSLHRLVEMRNLTITECAKLKAVQGCGQMKKLGYARFDGCSNLTVFPLANLDFPRHMRFISFDGCKFARNVEMMLAWAADKEAPYPLRKASLRALVWEYRRQEKEKLSSLLLEADGLLHKVSTQLQDRKELKASTQLKDRKELDFAQTELMSRRLDREGLDFTNEELERAVEELHQILYEI